MIASTLGPYQILEKLGEGGMGEVYLAQDSRLRRKVALKVLPQEIAGDDLSRRRLIREAQAAATLDHANICTIYEVGEAEGRSFIAMQYIEGETLASRLTRGPLDISVALALGTQVAAALAEAHRFGIVHRDVKPQNIMLTPSDQVKVLDFGLAKTAGAVQDDSRTVTRITELGTVAGTAPYMSPEQVRGELLDARSDVFSVGCVIYEMIGRVNPFLCDHPADTMSAVLTREPPPLAGAPPELQRIVRKCLEKDRERRYQTTRDLVIDLESAARELAPRRDGQPEKRASRPLAAGWRLPAIGVLVVASAALAGYLYLRSDTPARLSQDDFVQITGLPDVASAPALSPDGHMVAFIRGQQFLGTGQVYLKLLPNGDPVQLTNDPRPKYGLAFSPDGSRIAYTVIDHAATPSVSWDTWTVPVLGGQATRMLPNAAGLTWIDDHQVMFSEIEPGTGLHMGVVTAGEDRQDERRIYFPAEARAMAHYSYLSPDRRWVLVVEMDRTGSFVPCRVVPFDGSSAGRAVGPDGSCTAAAWSPDGRWMYFSVAVSGTTHLWRQRFPDGAPSQLTSGPTTEERGIAIAPDGRSLITSVGQSLGSLWIHDAAGDRLVTLDGSVSAPRMSSDGTRVYCLVQRIREPSAIGLTQLDLASGKAERILTDFSIIDFDISRDERFAAFTTGRQIWLAALDRRSPPRRIAEDSDHVRFAGAGELVYRSLTGATNALMRVSTDGRGAVRIFDRSVIELGDVSPDGEWAIVATPASSGSGIETFAVPIRGGSARQLCFGACPIKWSSDAGAAYLAVTDAAGLVRMVRRPLAPGQVLPDLSAVGAEVPHLSPAPSWDDAAPGPDPSTYVFTRSEERGNLFRVPLR